jgi:hypothetical protein
MCSLLSGYRRGHLMSPARIGRVHRDLGQRRQLPGVVVPRRHPRHQRVGGRGPLGRPAQPGPLGLVQGGDVEYALDVHQAGLGPGRARERLAGGALTRDTREHRAAVRRRAARRVPKQGPAEPR